MKTCKHTLSVFAMHCLGVNSCCISMAAQVTLLEAQRSHVQGSDQFMNWIGIDNQFNWIELKDFELELNWNWKPELIRIDQFNQFIFNSSPHFTRFDIFLWHIMEIAVWQAMAAMIKQAYPHAPLCTPSMGSAEVYGHEGLTISSITFRYFQWFNLLSLSDLQIWSTH